MKLRVLLASILAVACGNVETTPHANTQQTINPKTASFAYHRVKDGEFSVEGTWVAHPRGWAPQASVRIDCRKDPMEFGAGWADLYADAGGGARGPVPERKV